ncbi:hypothetical protein AVEN_146444-1 [Araneus ventricosus]|uniref:Uncharacterized protein n=1 Tax=Araneus ventricosus TaxID=182803 RepID=A0A4Y2UZQ9_ARAVE|nr:hypothetical protein AVEN_146444-1 [Araneus ventricosus]
MTRVTPDLSPTLSKLSHHTSGRTFGYYVWLSAQQTHLHDGSSMESGFEPGPKFPEAESFLLGHRDPTKVLEDATKGDLRFTLTYLYER